MKRFDKLVNSNCLECGAWLCATAGEYTGTVECERCGAQNVFRNSLKPCEAIHYESGQRQIRRATGEADADSAATCQVDRDDGKGGEDSPAYFPAINSA